MKHIKHIAMIIIGLGLSAGAAYMLKCHFMKPDTSSEVTIQKFGIGIFGESQNGDGFGIGIGGSDRGPVIGVGPWGSKSENNDTSKDVYNEEDNDNDEPYDDESYDDEEN